MKLSESGKNLIKGFEGLSLTAYKDADGYSIGYGHFGAVPGETITRARADELFDQDVRKFETAVSYTTPSATQAQFDAMVSLAYNIGTGGFASSTVARLHNMGDFQGAADAFRMWNKSQGAVHQGLVARREKERSFYLGGVTASPTHFPEPLPPQSVEPPANGWGSLEEEPTQISPPDETGRGPLKPAFVLSGFTLVAYVLYRLLHR
jgi:lysozyme